MGGSFLGLAYFDLYYNLAIFLLATKALVIAELAKTESAEIRRGTRTPRRARNVPVQQGK